MTSFSYDINWDNIVITIVIILVLIALIVVGDKKDIAPVASVGVIGLILLVIFSFVSVLMPQFNIKYEYTEDNKSGDTLELSEDKVHYLGDRGITYIDKNNSIIELTRVNNFCKKSDANKIYLTLHQVVVKDSWYFNELSNEFVVKCDQ